MPVSRMEGISKLWYIPSIESYIEMRIDEQKLYVTTWMNLTNMMRNNKKGQTQRVLNV